MTLSLWHYLALREAADGHVSGTLEGRPTLRAAFEAAGVVGLEERPDMPAARMAELARWVLAAVETAPVPVPASVSDRPGATQRPPVDVGADSGASNVALRAGQRFLRHSAGPLILGALAEGPSSGRALARRLGRRWSDVSRTLRDLEANGQVERSSRAGCTARWALVGGSCEPDSKGAEHAG